MASAKLQRILAAGTEEWNAWRIAHRGQRLDLREMIVERQNLTGINLSGADLRGASLRGSLVEHANLRGARFGKSDLRDVSFRRTVLDDIYFGSESSLQNAVSPRPRSLVHAFLVVVLTGPISVSLRCGIHHLRDVAFGKQYSTAQPLATPSSERPISGKRSACQRPITTRHPPWTCKRFAYRVAYFQICF